MKRLPRIIAIVGLATSLSAMAQNQDRKDILIGTSVPVSAGERTIVITPDTKHVNVKEDEVVKFVAGATEFAWRFDGQGSRSFNLQQVAPSGALANPVTVYVQAKPSFR